MNMLSLYTHTRACAHHCINNKCIYTALSESGEVDSGSFCGFMGEWTSSLAPPFLFSPFYFPNLVPISSFIHLSAQLAGSTPSPLTAPLPQLYRTTHYLQEDDLKSKSPLFSLFLLRNAKDFFPLIFSLLVCPTTSAGGQMGWKERRQSWDKS